MKKRFFILALFASLEVNAKSATEITACLQQAYPETVKAQGNQVMVNQSLFPVTYSADSHFLQKIHSAQLGDQLAQHYPRHFAIPAKNQDAGRLRHQPFFQAMYGHSESAVRSNLVKTYWSPAGKYVLFNRVNGANKALEKVGNEIAQNKALSAYVSKTAGTFNYRTIKGTSRLSPHAFAIAIDFTLPNKLGTYWQWSGCKEGGNCPYPTQLLQDKNLHTIVQIFEKHGFIWGGKWYHHDSVHFEYRPELLHPQCQ